jgi:hypothetical protein
MKNILYLFTVLAMIMAGCAAGGSKEHQAKEKAKMDSLSAPSSEKAEMTAQDAAGTNADNISSSAAVVSKKDSTRKFVRTADLKFRVKNVYRSTLEIEKIVAENDGFVTYTNLQSTIDRTTITAVSADSSLETIYYTVENNITLRVPNYNLDSTIRHIAPLISYLDYRIIKADDVSLMIAANNMAQQRINKTTQRITKAVDDKGKNLNETTNAEENIYNKQAHLDQVRIEKQKLMDEVNFSTINLNLYQRQVLKRELISNDKNIKAYEPGFWTKTKEAIVFSFDILLNIILFFIRIWAIILILVIVFIVLRKYLGKKE